MLTDECITRGFCVQSLVTLEGDKLIHRQTAKPGEFSATAIRERLQDGRILVVTSLSSHIPRLIATIFLLPPPQVLLYVYFQ